MRGDEQVVGHQVGGVSQVAADSGSPPRGHEDVLGPVPIEEPFD